MDIVSVILHYFPDADILPTYNPETGLHIFQVIMEGQQPVTSIKMPEGFFMTQVHFKGKRVVFEMLIHQQVYLDIYAAAPLPELRISPNFQPIQFFG